MLEKRVSEARIGLTHKFSDDFTGKVKVNNNG
jgi:hypothetical protein